MIKSINIDEDLWEKLTLSKVKNRDNSLNETIHRLITKEDIKK